MRKRQLKDKRLFVLDTNVLMHDPTAIFRFQEHDIFLPMMVLEELDRGKRGMSETARNVRQVSRFIDELMESADIDSIDEGLPLDNHSGINGNGGEHRLGRLFFQTRTFNLKLPKSLPGGSADNDILGTALALQEQHTDTTVIVVSKDINLRIKAHALGLVTEDYYNDKVLDDVDLLYKGFAELPADFWELHSEHIDSWQQDGFNFYSIDGDDVQDWHPQQGLQLQRGADEAFEAIVQSIDGRKATLRMAVDYRKPAHQVWGINARNREQNFALNLLMDPQVDFVSLLGMAGTGKTLLALAAGLQQVVEEKRYREIVMTRVTVPVGEDIGFLPGTEEEKMTPWMGALMDNLEVLSNHADDSEWKRGATNDILMQRIKIRSLNFMRGRTFLDRYLIIDEAQNLTPKQMKTLITRAGPGTKIICIGNIAQIDTPYLSETTSGLTYVVDQFKFWEHSGHVTLIRGERSRLADYASDHL